MTSTAKASDHSNNPSAQLLHKSVQFLRVLRYRRNIVIATSIAALLLGALYYWTTPRAYRASASLLVTQTGDDLLGSERRSEGSQQVLMATYERVFTSPVVLEGAVPELAALPGQLYGELAPVPVGQWAQAIGQRLQVQNVRGTNIIQVSYDSQNPQTAVAVVNAVVRSYLQFMEKNHKNVSAEIVGILSKERRDLEQRIEVKERALLQLKQSMGDLALKEDSQIMHPLVERAIGLNRAVLETQQKRVELEASLAAVRSAIRSGGDLRQHLMTIEPVVGRELVFDALGLNSRQAPIINQTERELVANQAKLAALLEYYGEQHPQVRDLHENIHAAKLFIAQHQQHVQQRLQELQNGELAQMLDGLVREQLAQAWEHENKLTQEFREAESQAVALNGRLAEASMMSRDLKLLHGFYDVILNRISSLDINENQAQVHVSVLGEPKPSRQPVSPQPMPVIFFCILGGLGGGATIVYILDVLDDRFRSPEDIRDQLGVPVLAMIRKLAGGGSTGAQSLQVCKATTSVESEAFRTLRTALAFSGQDLTRVSVTSSEPADGKTTVLANLAATYAQAGKRTLVIDCDLRLPGLSKLFQMRGMGGLTEVLRGHDEIASMCRARVQRTEIENLDILPCGPKPADPAELLASRRMADVVAWAEQNYEQILLDCPPVLAASDAAIVGRLTDGMILVVQPEKNHRRLVIRAADNLVAMQVKLIGVVANRVSTEKGGGYYGYGYGYGYGDGAGYGHQEDAAEDAQDEQPTDEQPTDEQPQRIRPRRAA